MAMKNSNTNTNKLIMDAQKHRLLQKYVFFQYNSVPVLMFEQILTLLITASVIFPYILQTYVPVMLTSFYVPLLMTFGLHITIFLNNHIAFVILAFLFCLLTIMTIVWTEVEIFSFVFAFQRHHPTISIPPSISIGASKVLLNITYMPVSDSRIPSQGIYLIGIFNIVLVAYAFTRMLFGASTLYQYAQIMSKEDSELTIEEDVGTTVDETGEVNVVNENDECAKDCKRTCDSSKSLHLMLIYSFAFCVWVICMVEWVMGLVMISNGSQILNPVNYNSLLQAYICIPLLCIPKPRKLHHNERVINISKNTRLQSTDTELMNNMKRAQLNNEDYIIDNVPIELIKDRYSMLITICSLVIIAVLLSMYQLTSQSVWLFRNGANLYSLNSLETTLSRELYLNFTNVRSFHYQINPETGTQADLSLFADYTYTFAILDMLNLAFTIVLFVLVYIYLYRVLSTKLYKVEKGNSSWPIPIAIPTSDQTSM